MASVVTTKLIEALKRTTDRINDFLNTNGEFFGELNLSPYGFMAFCSFLVVASYAPARKYFPDTVVEREEADTEEFKQIVIQSMTQSLMERHSGALELIESEEDRKRQFQAMTEQVANLLNSRHAEYFADFKKDVERLAEEQTNIYGNLSAAFMRDVLGKEDHPDAAPTGPALGNLTFGLCLSTTVSGLMSFFDGMDAPAT